MRRVLAVTAASILVACASAPRQPAFDPAGTYDFTTQVQGTAVSGVLTLRRGDQGLTGVLSSQMGEMPLSSVTVEDRKLQLRASTPNGDVVMNLEFTDNDRFTGGWSLAGAGASGAIEGVRRPPAR